MLSGPNTSEMKALQTELESIVRAANIVPMRSSELFFELKAHIDHTRSNLASDQTIPIIMGEDFSIDPICFVKPAVTQKRASCEIGVLLDCELTCDARRTSKADVRSMQANVCFVPIAD